MANELNLGKIRNPSLSYIWYISPVIFLDNNGDAKLEFNLSLDNPFSWKLPENSVLCFDISIIDNERYYHTDGRIFFKRIITKSLESYSVEQNTGEFSFSSSTILSVDSPKIKTTDNPLVVLFQPYCYDETTNEHHPLPLSTYACTVTPPKVGKPQVDGDTIVYNTEGELQSNYYSSCFPNLRLENGHLYADYPDGVKFDGMVGGGCRYLGDIEVSAGTDTSPGSIASQTCNIENSTIGTELFNSKSDLIIISQTAYNYPKLVFRLVEKSDLSDNNYIEYTFQNDTSLENKYITIKVDKETKAITEVAELVVIQEVSGSQIVTKFANNSNTDLKFHYYLFESPSNNYFEYINIGSENEVQ